TQSFLSKRCGVSLGNVNHAVEPLASMNAIEKKPRGFTVIGAKKILLYWASTRNLDKDIVYQTFSNISVIEIEKIIPVNMFTAYSGFKFKFNSTPSDYSEVFAYGNAEKVKERFAEKKGRPNVIVLKTDKHLMKFKQIPIAQLFVDLWNINTWYSQEFLKVLEAKINGILE
ncbi:MAG: hypothetical protein COS07_01670, partial [Candidatus Aenigmarchaeota archaeon CG01_land_8_20_14_3_00_37_9]